MIENIIKKVIEYFGSDIKRINHAIKVYTFATNIAKLEHIDKEKLQIIQMAAILHDIGIKESERKYNSSSGKYQEIEGPKVAKDILKDFKLDKTVLERVMFLIGNHHTYNKIDDMDFQVLVESDFIINIFEDNLNKEQIKNIRNKYFKTNSGINYLEKMYNGSWRENNNE